MSEHQQLIVKLTAACRPEAGPRVIRAAVGPDDVDGVEPLFPGDPEPGMAGLFSVTLKASASAPDAIRALEKDESVEYAHVPSSKKPL